MKTKRFLIGCVLLVMSLAVYAQDYAELYLIRDNVSLVSGNSHEVVINGVALSYLPNDGYFHIQIPVGRNVIKTNTSYVDYSSSSQNSFGGQRSGVTRQTSLGTTIMAEAGAKYYVKIIEVPLPKLSLVKKEKAIEKIDKKIEEGKLNLMGEYDVTEVSPTVQKVSKSAPVEEKVESVSTSEQEEQQQTAPQKSADPRMRMLQSMQY